MTAPSPALASEALALTALHKRLGAADIIRGVSLTLRQGERVALIGPNGAGKSTLFNLVSGAMPPDQGEIRLRQKRIDGLAPHQVNRLGLSRSFQVSSVFGGLSVFENLRCAVLWSEGVGYAFWRRLSRLAAANDRALRMLALLGLEHRRDVPAGQLSYAEQRALELGLTVAGGAHTVLLDEPTAGMSRAETAHFVALIRRLTEGRTLLIVEHDMSVVFELADRIAVLVDGEIVAFGPVDAVRADPRVQAAYLGKLP
jgi:branched-chain amino acid transport system ATP-binding protein